MRLVWSGGQFRPRIEAVHLALDVRAYLPVDGSLEIPLEPFPTGAEVKLVGLHVAPRAGGPTTFLDLRLTEE